MKCMNNLPETVESPIDLVPVSPEALQRQVNAIQEAMKQVMEEGVHYGKVPGCGDKPALFKPGAEKINLLFRLVPEFIFETITLPNGHFEIITTCYLHVGNLKGQVVGQGIGSCSTMETKYRYRNGERVCPSCGKPCLIQSSDFKTKAKDGWLCFAKKGGCGVKYPLGDAQIESQIVGKIDNPDIADQYNTVRKMSKKRAHVDCTITATAASDIFTQDIEDMPELASQPSVVVEVATKQPEKKEAPKQATQQRQAPASVEHNENEKLGFGKHKEESWANVGNDYLEWLVGKADARFSPRALAEIDRRKMVQEIPNAWGNDDMPNYENGAVIDGY
jgi:hypothetical protein